MRIHQRCLGWRLVAVRLCTRRVRNSHAMGYTTDVPSSPNSQPQPTLSEFGSVRGASLNIKNVLELRHGERLDCSAVYALDTSFILLASCLRRAHAVQT